MVVCHCHGVSERAIRKAVRGGACSRREVTRSCQAGRTCGGCVPAIDEIVASEASAEAATALPTFSGLVASTG